MPARLQRGLAVREGPIQERLEPGSLSIAFHWPDHSITSLTSPVPHELHSTASAEHSLNLKSRVKCSEAIQRFLNHASANEKSRSNSPASWMEVSRRGNMKPL